MYSFMGNIVDVKDFSLDLTSKNVFLKLVFAYLIGIFYAKIGYTFGLLFKNIVVGIVTIIGYVYLVPNLGAYDLKNSIYLLAIKTFDFYGVVSIDKVHDTPIIYAIFIVLFILIIFSIVDIYIIKNRSMYE